MRLLEIIDGGSVALQAQRNESENVQNVFPSPCRRSFDTTTVHVKEAAT